jgi:hypothetical protein
MTFLLLLIREGYLRYFIFSHKTNILNDDLVGSILLLGLAKDVDGPSGLVGGVRDVVTTTLVSANLLNLLEVLLGQLNLLEVVADTGCGDGLRDDGVATNLCPGENNLCGSGIETLGDLLDDLVLDEEGLADHVVTEGGVLGDVDTLLAAPLDEVGLEEAGVALDLVGGRGDTGAVNEGLEVLLGVVGDTDGAGLLLVKLGHGLPCVDDRDVVKHLDVTVVAEGEQVLVDIASLIESDGEVDEVQVEVLEAELSKAVVKGGSDVLGSVLRVPELGRDEDVLTLDTLAESSLEGVGNLLLVAVDLGKIDVLVAGLEGLVDGGLDLTGLSLPCTESQLTVVVC